jgi:hypothetical protein
LKADVDQRRQRFFRDPASLEVEEGDVPQMREDRDGGNGQQDACGAPP